MKLNFLYSPVKELYHIIIEKESAYYTNDTTICILLDITISQFRSIVDKYRGKRDGTHHITFFKDRKDCLLAIEQLETYLMMNKITGDKI